MDKHRASHLPEIAKEFACNCSVYVCLGGPCFHKYKLVRKIKSASQLHVFLGINKLPIYICGFVAHKLACLKNVLECTCVVGL